MGVCSFFKSKAKPKAKISDRQSFMSKLVIYSERARKVTVGAMSALAPIAVGPLVVIYGYDLISNPYVQSVGIGLGLWGIYLLKKQRARWKEPPDASTEARISSLLNIDE